MAFASKFGPDEAPQNIGPHQETCLTLRLYIGKVLNGNYEFSHVLKETLSM